MSEKNKNIVKGKTEPSKEENVIRYGFIALGAILVVSVLAYIIISILPNNLIMVGNRKITDEEFNYYYLQERSMLLQYKDSIAPNMSDSDFMNAPYSETMSFHDLAKHRAISRLQEVYILNDWAKNNPDFRYDTNELQDSKNTFKTKFEEYAFSINMKPDDVAKQLYGTSFNMVMKNHEISWIAQKYEQFLNEKIKGEVGDDEVLSYYNTYSQNYDTAKVRHILITTFDTETGEAYSEEKYEEAKRRAEGIYERVLAGEDMIKLAEEFSEDPGVEQNQGEYSFRKGDAYLEEFVEWSFSAEVNEIGLVETDAGFHVMKLLSMSGFEEAFDEVKETIVQSRIMQMVDNAKQTSEYQVKFYDAFRRF